jgi:hypothetical protein
MEFRISAAVTATTKLVIWLNVIYGVVTFFNIINEVEGYVS